MADAKKILDFIKECFSEFGIRYEPYFYVYDDEEFDPEGKEIEWVDKDGNLLPEVIPFASEILGISETDLFNCNEDALYRWMRKYPYFKYISPFEVAYERTYFDGAAYDVRRIYEVLFDKRLDGSCPTRFDYADIKSRLISQLREIDKSLPGTFHEGATINHLQISTNNFCHFAEIKEMTESYLSMVDRAITLFLKAVKKDLVVEEIHEYNLLVSVLGLSDCSLRSHYIYYSVLVKTRDLYASVTRENIRNDIAFTHSMDFMPWRCADFIDNEVLVRRYLEAVPEAKGRMREFGVKASNFECIFEWSDAKPIQYSPEEEAEMAYIDHMLGEKPIPLEKRRKENTTIYVGKTEKELAGDDKTAKALIGYCRPIRLGGLESKRPSAADTISRLDYLRTRIKSNNLMEQIESGWKVSGGGD